MPYYHATQRDRLPSILKRGLGWSGAEPNWPGIERGVYLAEKPEHAVFIAIDWFMQAAADDASPAQYLDNLVLILIDDTRVARAQLGPDPDISRDGIWLYRGVIDVRNMPILETTDVLAPPEEPADLAETVNWMRSIWGKTIAQPCPGA